MRRFLGWNLTNLDPTSLSYLVQYDYYGNKSPLFFFYDSSSRILDFIIDHVLIQNIYGKLNTPISTNFVKNVPLIVGTDINPGDTGYNNIYNVYFKTLIIDNCTHESKLVIATYMNPATDFFFVDNMTVSNIGSYNMLGENGFQAIYKSLDDVLLV